MSRVRISIESAVLAVLAQGCLFPKTPDPPPAGETMSHVREMPVELTSGQRVTDTALCSEACGHFSQWCERAATYSVRCGQHATVLDSEPRVAGEERFPMSRQACLNACGGGTACSLVRKPDGTLSVACVNARQCFGGRLTQGLRHTDLGSWTTIAGYFGHMAALESSSVSAFHQLAQELEAHDAPTRLVEGAREAATDEARHYRQMRSLARRFGAAAPPGPSRRGPTRPVVELAIENAVEGGVAELLGAALLRLQSLRAADPRTRRVLATIADDEIRHAELARDVHDWCMERLDEAERRRVNDAIQIELAELRRRGPEPGDDVRRATGLPSEDERLALVRALSTATLARPG